ncbi:MAG: hypothetical protein LBL13_04605, partial [Bacteroidales bacterium]|nr:hypothetical protein [Bacteroidales bacterium]
GSIDFLRNETKINVSFDFSKVEIEGKPVKYWIAKEGEEWKNDWEEAIPEFSEKFVRTLNAVMIDKSRDLDFGNFQEANYQLTVQFLTIDDDNDVKALLIFSQNNSQNALAEISINGKAGKFGSMANLIGDAMIDAGEKFGKFLIRKIE